MDPFREGSSEASCPAPRENFWNWTQLPRAGDTSLLFVMDHLTPSQGAAATDSEEHAGTHY